MGASSTIGTLVFSQGGFLGVSNVQFFDDGKTVTIFHDGVQHTCIDRMEMLCDYAARNSTVPIQSDDDVLQAYWDALDHFYRTYYSEEEWALVALSTL